MDVPRNFSVSRLSTTLPRSLPAETPQKAIKWEHRNGSMTLSASIASTVLHLRLLDGSTTIITYHLPPLALESPPTKTPPRIVHQDSHVMFRLPSQQSGKAGLRERFQCRFASSDTARALLDLLRPYFSFHAKSGPGPSQDGKGPSDSPGSGSLPPQQSGLGRSTTSRAVTPSTEAQAGENIPANQPALTASPALVDIDTPPVQGTFPPTPVSRPNGRAPSSNTPRNDGGQLVQPQPLLVTQTKLGLNPEIVDHVALKKELLKGYSDPSRSNSQVNTGPGANALDAAPVAPPAVPKAIHTPVSIPERLHTPNNSQSQDIQSVSRDPFAQALWNDPAVVRSFSEIPIFAESDAHLSGAASASQPKQTLPSYEQNPLTLISGAPMEVELISLESPRLADAVPLESSSQNELEGIRFDPDPLWDEEGEAYAGWTQVEDRFPPMSKIEADAKMEEEEGLEEDYEQLQYHSHGGLPFRFDSQSSHEQSSRMLPPQLYRPDWSIYALDEVQLESLISQVVLEAGFDELVERVANIVESRLASQEMQLQDRDARSSGSPHPSHPRYGWPDDRAGQYFSQEDHRPVQYFPREIDIEVDCQVDARQDDWRGYLPPTGVPLGQSESRLSGFKDMDIDEDLDDDLELESASH